MSAYSAVAVHGAAWLGTTPRAMRAEDLFPAVGQFMRFQLRPELWRQATVMPRPGVRLIGYDFLVSVVAIHMPAKTAINPIIKLGVIGSPTN